MTSSTFYILLAGLVTLIATTLIFNAAVIARFQPSLRLEAKSITERQSSYGLVWPVFATNPITGVGIGGYTPALAQLQPNQPVWFYQPVHNTYFLILAELGLLGLVLWLVWLVTILNEIWSVHKTTGGIFAITLGSALAIIALFDHYLWSSWPGLALSAFVIALAIRLSSENQTRQEPNRQGSRRL